MILYPDNATLLPFRDINQLDRDRVEMGNLEELASNIKKIGIIHPPVVTYLGGGLYRLIAGGRRMAALRMLEVDPVPVMIREMLQPHEIKEMELAENFHRKQMTWQETVINIAKGHRLKSQAEAADMRSWGMRETGDLLGVSHTHVMHSIHVADLLLAGDEELAKCDGLRDAYQLLLKRKEEDALKRVDVQQAMMIASSKTIDRTGIQVNKLADSDVADVLHGKVASPSDIDRLLGDPNPTSSTEPLTKGLVDQIVFPITKLFHLADSMEFMPKLEANCFDHIVTDPPYGIDMDNMAEMKNIDDVVSTHDVAQNISMFEPFLAESFRLVKPNGFVVFWYDLDHHEKLQIIAKKIGFRVQRWPIVWHKLHQCKNNAATFNWTKNVEFAMVLRKGNASLLSPQQSCIVQADGKVDAKLYTHPFAKPAKVWNFILDAIAVKGQTIFDPYGGEMSCPRACINNGYIPMACEKLPDIFNAGVEQIKKLITDIHKGNAKFE